MEHSRRTARVKWEEGVGDGRSVWSECPGLHAAYSGWNNGSQLRKEKLIPEIQSWSGLRIETHPHEDGMASNRGSLISAVTEKNK